MKKHLREKFAALRMLERGKLFNEEIVEDLDLPIDIVNGMADEFQLV